jgi:hypothetical protein
MRSNALNSFLSGPRSAVRGDRRRIRLISGLFPATPGSDGWRTRSRNTCVSDLPSLLLVMTMKDGSEFERDAFPALKMKVLSVNTMDCPE